MSRLRSALEAGYERRRGIRPEQSLSSRDLISIAGRRVGPLIRGALHAAQPYANYSMVHFRGRGVRIDYGSRLQICRGVVLGDHVYINALGTSGIVLGPETTVGRGAILEASGTVARLGSGIRVGRRVAIGAYNVLWGQGGMSIGDGTLLGPFVTVVSSNHGFRDVDIPIWQQREEYREVIIGTDCWIGSGATILAGCTIGDGSVVAAGSVVRESVGPGSIVAGVPGRVVGTRG